MYVTSGAIEEQGPVYSEVVKSKKTNSGISDKYEVETQGTVYAEVRKTDKKGRQNENVQISLLYALHTARQRQIITQLFHSIFLI